MKRILTIIALTPFILLILVFGILSVRYSPVYMYRLVTQNVADVHDYKLYENRTIEGAGSAFRFINGHDDPFVEGLFRGRVARSGFDDLNEWAVKSQTTALIFIRNDTILFEKYFNGFSRDSYFHSQSMAKSFISFLIGAAIDDGLISTVNDPITKYIPELLQRDYRFGNITIKNLLEMRSGLNYNTSYLGLILERATSRTVSDYLGEKLWSRTMEYDALFSVDSRKSGFEYMPSRLMARAIDYARFGRLYLNLGDWNGIQIISADWVMNSTREDKSIPGSSYPAWFEDGCKNGYYSYQWWGHSNCDSTFQYSASGNLGQTIYVIPGKQVIIVHCGNSLDHYGDYDLWEIAEQLRGSA